MGLAVDSSKYCLAGVLPLIHVVEAATARSAVKQQMLSYKQEQEHECKCKRELECKCKRELECKCKQERECK
jgi:hypothetical protein